MSRALFSVSGLLCVLLTAGQAAAQGTGGDPKDRLDWPGSPTDRYLDAGEVRDTLHGATEGFFACFRDALRSKPEGGASVAFGVDRAGKAQDIQVEIGKAPESLRPCVEGVVSLLEFGDHDGDVLEVSYPLVYDVDAKGARILPYPIVFTKPRPVRLPLIALPLDVTAGELRMLELILTVDGPTEAVPDTTTQEPADP